MSDTSTFGILDGYAPVASAAIELKTTVRNLRALDRKGSGPAGRVKVGRKVYYHVETLRQWLAANVQQPVRNARHPYQTGTVVTPRRHSQAAARG